MRQPGPASAEVEPKILFVCLFPDLGHVQPMTRLAGRLSSKSVQMRFLLPKDCSAAARSAGFSVIDLPYGKPAAADPMFRSVLNKSTFKKGFSGYAQSNLLLNPPLFRAIADCLPEIAAMVDDFAPDIIVGDQHLFSEVYIELSRRSGAHLVISSPSGTLAARHPLYDRVFGLSDASPPFKQAVTLLGRTYQRIFKTSYYLLHLKLWKEAKASKRAYAGRLGLVRQASGDVIATPQPLTVTSGLDWVEERFLDAASDPVRSELNPPLAPILPPIDETLTAWLEAVPDDVLYVCFGSMIRLSQADYSSIARALIETGKRVVWSVPKSDLGFIKSLMPDERRFLISSFVPQPALLARPEVVGCISHGGASTVIESLFGGCPMIIVPLYSDGPYIGSLVAKLGLGVKVGRGQLNGSAFRNALLQTFDSPAIRDRAREVAEVLHAASDQFAIETIVLKRLGDQPGASGTLLSSETS